MALLLDPGEISYNGFIFGPETETLSVSIKPIFDSSRRTFIANLYVFVIKTYIIAFKEDIIRQQDEDLTPTNDELLETIRTQLLVNSGAFVYDQKGLGSIHVNTVDMGNKQDLAWGPVVEEVGWKPKGALASEMTLRISFQINDCSGAIDEFALMEFCYSMEYSQGHDRLTRRTFSGHIKIPETLQSPGSKALVDSIDNYAELIWLNTPDGWRMEESRRKIDEAKTRMDFTFVQVQLKMPMPEGMIDYHWEHEQVNTKGGIQFVHKSGRISMNCEVALHWPMQTAQTHFDNLWASILTPLQDQNLIIMHVYNARQVGMDRRAEFSVTYDLIRKKNLAAIVGPQGFWLPIPLQAFPNAPPSVDFSFYTTSMQNANQPRGYTRDQLDQGSDIIISLCKTATPISPGALSFTPSDFDDYFNFFDQPIPTPENSWIWWECAVESSTDDGVVEHKPLPGYNPPWQGWQPNGPRPPSNGSGLDQTGAYGGTEGFNPIDPALNVGGTQSVIMQQRVSPTTHLWLTGYGLRIGYNIPAPILNFAFGSDVIKNNRDEEEYYDTMVVGNIGIPIVLARWRQRYTVLDQPTSPLYTIDGPLITSANIEPLEINPSPGA